MKLLLIVLLLILLLIRGIVYWVQKKQYEKTDYYRQTHNSFYSVQFDTGIKGEYLTWQYLRELTGYGKYLFNCYLPKDNGETTELDVVLLHESGIYVFESKNYSGWIFGSETQQYWTQTLSKGRGKAHKERFFNPIIQNKVHIKWLSMFLEKEPEQFYSYIVFSDRCTLKDITLTSGHHHVINRYDILSAVNENVESVGTKLTPAEIDELYVRLQPLTQVDEAVKLAHIEDVKKKQETKSEKTAVKKAQAGKERIAKAQSEEIQVEKIQPEEIQVEKAQSEKIQTEEAQCPRCGGQLILRTAVKGQNAGNKFWGCSNYPKCRYIRNAETTFVS